MPESRLKSESNNSVKFIEKSDHRKSHRRRSRSRKSSSRKKTVSFDDTPPVEIGLRHLNLVKKSQEWSIFAKKNVTQHLNHEFSGNSLAAL